MDKGDVRQIYTHTHTHTQWNISHKKNEIMPFVVTSMDLEIMRLSEVSLKEKDKYCMISLICGINKKNLWNK